MKERPLAIKLHNPTHLLVWQYVLLSFSVLSFLVLGTSLNVNILPYGIIALIILSLSANLFFNSRPLILTSTTIKLPQGAMTECAPQSITGLKLTRYTWLEIEITEQEKTKRENLDLNFLSKEDATLLWQWLSKHLSHAQIDPKIREALLNWQQYRTFPSLAIKPSLENRKSEPTQVELTFTPESLLIASPGLKSLLMTALGQLWLNFCLWASTVILFALAAPLRDSMKLNDLAFPLLFLPMIAVQYLFSIFPPEAVGVTTLSVSIIFATRWLIQQSRPNSLFIDHLGLTIQNRQLVSLESESYSTVFHSHIPWGTISSVKLSRESPLSAAPDCLLFQRSDGKSSFTLPLNFMRTKKEKQQFLTLLQKYQANHDFQIDTQAIQSLKDQYCHTPEYTQLWLKSFHHEAAPLTSPQVTATSEQPKLKIIEEIASGGQAMTYKAKKISAPENEQSLEEKEEKEEEEEVVVLKEFFLSLKNEGIYKKQALKFEKSAAFLKTLHHENLVRVNDYFINGPKACLLLEYIEGTTLAESIIKNGIFSETQAIDLALSMCDILTYLHGQNPPLLHLDFTPENLILDTNGLLKLIDLDSCLVHRNHNNGVKNRTVIGKQNYTPIEQLQGHPDLRSDIFALGATLFYLTTGKKPEPFTVLHPRNFNVALHKSFDAIIAKASAIQVEERYSCVEELKKDFLMLKESQGANDETDTILPVPTELVITTEERLQEHSS